MENVQSIGRLLAGGEQRDAIHVAIAPVRALRTLSPGQHIGVLHNTASDGIEPHIGIVDPYLTTKVMKDDLFWLFLYPNTVTSLRHNWSHQAFDITVKPTMDTVDDDDGPNCSC